MTHARHEQSSSERPTSRFAASTMSSESVRVGVNGGSMSRSVQQSSFASLTALHMRDIEAELSFARGSRRSQASPTALANLGVPQPEVVSIAHFDTVSCEASATEPVPRRAPPMLDALPAERLDSGSLIFPADDFGGWSAEPAWQVFSSHQAAEPDEGVVLFAQAGVIGGELGDDAFVELAYKLILQRQPDPGGHRAYRETLQSGQKTRHGVLRDLAGSAEAGATGQLLVILPGSWLAGAAGACENVPDAVRIDLSRLPPASAGEQDGRHTAGEPVSMALMSKVAAAA